MKNPIKQIIDLGTTKQTDPVVNRHIRFCNSVALIVCLFVVQNFVLAVYYKQTLIAFVLGLHFILLALMPVFNYAGKRLLASTWFSSVAILFVTFYAIVFTLEGLNFTFLPMIIFLQFFLFTAAEKKYIILFTVVTLVCFAGVILWPVLHLPQIVSVPEQFIEAQRLSTYTGLPLLSIAFGAYALSSIHTAEQQTAKEKEKTDHLLLNILPQSIAERFKNDQTFLAEGYDSVTVLFADIVGFTGISQKVTPNELVKFLNEVFSKFDALTEEHGLEKIKTIGDAYMVAGGVPARVDHHTRKICMMALKMQAAIKDIRSPGGEPLRMRIGISAGPVTAGVIGVKKFIYDLWGDTVNTASRMESHSEEGSIQITEEAYELIKNEFECKPRGIIQVKGKGAMSTYFLVGLKVFP
ncbi:MAG TPA: adenylate/guanylate cyclase domain-containing protein [Chitinophagales bacterium]|nr:adenylate/guanylate cyclase domain-containing protein [Chitinophagales bacterium]